MGLARTAAPQRRPKIGSIVSRNTSFASASVRRNIFKVVQSHKTGVALPEFLDFYRKEIGVTLIAGRYGFRNLPDFFLSMPDVCKLEYGRRDKTGNTLYVFPPKAIKTIPTLLPVSNADENVTENAEANKKNLQTVVVGKYLPESDEAAESDPKQRSDKDDKQALDNPVLPSCQLVKSEILQILGEELKGVWAARVPVLYKKKFKKELEIEKLGYFSIIEFLSTLSDEVRITRPNPKGDWFLVNRSQDLKKKAKMSEHLYNNEGLEIVKMELKEIIIKSEKGIFADKLFETYEKVYRHKIDHEEFNISNPEVSVAALIDGVCICRKEGRIIVTLTDDEKNLMRGLFPKSHPKNPTDAVGPNASYKLLVLPSSDAQYIDVFVSDVTSPEYFMVQICGKKTTGALNRLMDDLEKLYCSPAGDEYKFPPSMVKIGQICAAIFMEDLNWHRAVIVRIDEEGYVDVLYVDYGSIAAVPIASLRRLRSRFLQLPAQMVKARLAHIKPRHLTSWTLESRNCMLDMCRDRPLVAMITKIENRVLSLCLCDTTNPDLDLHINDTLVDKKHAVFFPDGLTKGKADKLRSFLLQQMKAEESGDYVLDKSSSSHSSVLSNDSNNLEMMRSKSVESTPNISTVNFKPESEKHDESLGHVTGNIGTQNAEIAPSKELLCCIQKHTIVDGKYTFHLINYEGNPMVRSSEISLLFRQSSDVLRPLLLMKNLRLTELVVGKDEKHAQLFKELDKHGSSENNIPQNMLCLYRLQDIPAMVNGIGHEQENVIIQDVVKILTNFDPNSNYWTGGEKLSEGDASTKEEELDKLVKQREELSGKRKVLLERLANESSSETVDEVIELEQKICDIEKKIHQYSSTYPKEVGIDSESSLVRNAMLNQYGARQDCPRLNVTSFLTSSTPDLTRVAEVVPYIKHSEKKDEQIDADLSVIPGAQMQHDVVEFTPRAHITTSESPSLLVPGTSGPSNWPGSQLPSLVLGQTNKLQQQLLVPRPVSEWSVSQDVAFMSQHPHSTVSLGNGAQIPVGLPQWRCVTMPQQQLPTNQTTPQIFQNPQAPIFLSHIGCPTRGTVSVQQPGLVYENQNRGIPLQSSGAFSLFMPVQGIP